MSELLNETGRHGELRWRLLTTASAVALLASTYGAGRVFAANDTDRPTVWLELGSQLERVDAAQEPFAPPFEIANEGATYRPVSPLDGEKLARYGIGGEAKISLQPKGSDWIFSAGVVYGRSNSSRHVHQQTEQKVKQLRPILSKYLTSFHGVTKFSDVTAGNRESHTILDFAAGKDVGLGMLRGHSTLSFGVRFAQLGNTSDAILRSFPDQYFGPIYHSPASDHHHSFYGVNHASRSFRGLGPSLSWSGAAPIVGTPETTELTFDWGANAAVLFGRQKVSGEHKTTGRFFTGTYFFSLSRYQNVAPINRSKVMVVPNVGGFAGLTFRRANAKVSFGYRADFFFGAMDGGIDTRQTETVGFHGPFATISIGLGG